MAVKTQNLAAIRRDLLPGLTDEEWGLAEQLDVVQSHARGESDLSAGELIGQVKLGLAAAKSLTRRRRPPGADWDKKWSSEAHQKIVESQLVANWVLRCFSPLIGATRAMTVGADCTSLDDLITWLKREEKVEEALPDSRKIGTFEIHGHEVALHDTAGNTAKIRLLVGVARMIQSAVYWSLGETVAYLGAFCLPELATARVEVFDQQSLPCQSRITLELDPSLSPDEVARIYSDARSKLLPGKARSVQRIDRLELADFCFGRIENVLKPPDWERMRIEWNTMVEASAYDWPTYQYASEFKRTAKAACCSILDPRGQLGEKRSGRRSTFIGDFMAWELSSEEAKAYAWDAYRIQVPRAIRTAAMSPTDPRLTEIGTGIDKRSDIRYVEIDVGPEGVQR